MVEHKLESIIESSVFLGLSTLFCTVYSKKCMEIKVSNAGHPRSILGQFTTSVVDVQFIFLGLCACQIPDCGCNTSVKLDVL